MLNIGALVLQQKTGKIGQIFGYGHQIIDGVYLTTFKVKIVKDVEPNQKSFVEDLSSEWIALDYNEKNWESYAIGADFLTSRASNEHQQLPSSSVKTLVSP